MYRSVFVFITAFLAASQAGDINNLNDIYGACQNPRGVCLRPPTAQQCIALRNCEYMVYVLIENGITEIALTTYPPYEYVAVGFNEVNNSMSPAVTIECINDGQNVNAYLSRNPEGHTHERVTEGDPGFMVSSTVLDNTSLLCQVKITTITTAGLTLDLQNTPYYSLIALGKLKTDGSTELTHHDKKEVSDEPVDFSQ